MRAAGIGFRKGADIAALRDALARAGGGAEVLATRAAKADAPVLQALAAELGLKIIAIPDDHLAQQTTLTNSPRVAALTGAGSVAEAAALAAAGPGARLIGHRAVSACAMATAAIAERISE